MKNIFINEDITNIINFDNFEDVYILLSTCDSIPKQFYYLEVSEELFNKVSEKLIIYKVGKSILNVTSHKYNSVMVAKQNLLKYNVFNYELTNNNLVIPILDINYCNIQNYLDQFINTNKSSLLKNIYNFIMLNNHFKVDDNISNNKLLYMINNSDFSKFWSNQKNLNINKNDIYYHKIIGYEEINKTIKNVIFLENDDTIIEEINKNDIYELFLKINNKCRFLLFCNLLVSNNYCHLVINNYKLLELMKKYLNEPKFNKLFKYIIGYTWLKLYLDEVKGDLSNNMFDINTATLLPRFSFSQKNFKNNPYIPIICYDNIDYISGVNSDFCNGINNLDGFKKYLNIYCSSNESLNIFENINFKEYNMVICGSTITACSQKEPLLMELFNEKTLLNYFSEYYPNADIDIMFLVDSNKSDNFIIDNYNIEFINRVRQFYNQINQNICNINKPYAESSHNKLVCNKHVKLYLTIDKIIEVLNKADIYDINNTKTNQELYRYLNNNDSIEERTKLFLPIYQEMYNNLSINKDEFIDYPELFDENIIFKVCMSDNISVDISFKYYITSPYINHKLELFCIKNNTQNGCNETFNSLISKFYLPCVRGYYDGNNVYMTPSCVSSYLTNMNIDYKEFHHNINNIIIKYHMRGFGTFMNNSKKRKIKTFLQSITFNKIYNSSLSLNYYGLEEMFNNKIYKPRFHIPELYENSDYIDTVNRYKKYKNIKPIITNYSDDILNSQIHLKIIDDDNNICKLKKWIINLYFDEFEYIFEDTNHKKYKEIINDDHEIDIIDDNGSDDNYIE